METMKDTGEGPCLYARVIFKLILLTPVLVLAIALLTMCGGSATADDFGRPNSFTLQLQDRQSWMDYYAAFGFPVTEILPEDPELYSPFAGSFCNQGGAEGWLPLGTATGASGKLLLCYKPRRLTPAEAADICAPLFFHLAYIDDRRAICVRGGKA